MDKTLAQLKIPGADNKQLEVKAPDGVPVGGSDTLSTIISLGIQLFLIVVIVAALFFIVWAGIKWTMSSGDAAKIESARQQIIFAVIGLVVALFGFVIITALGGIFGISLI